MIETPISKRGGKRQGAGRKADPLKDIRTGATTAARLLKELDSERKIKEIFETCQDARLKTHIIFHLREEAYGKARQAQEFGFDPNAPLRVIIEHIGRPKDQAATQAKFAGKPLE